MEHLDRLRAKQKELKEWERKLKAQNLQMGEV